VLHVLSNFTCFEYLGLPAPQRKIVREVIQAFAKAFPVEEKIPSKPVKSKR
jgi:hypothetical protein